MLQKAPASPFGAAALLLPIAIGTACRTGPGGSGPDSPPRLARVGPDLAPLRSWFARNDGFPRAIALLSPT